MHQNNIIMLLICSGNVQNVTQSAQNPYRHVKTNIHEFNLALNLNKSCIR
jgi:hypothetical protein